MKPTIWTALALTLALGGCAPLVVAGGPMGTMGAALGRGLEFGQCSMFSSAPPEAARIGLRSPLMSIGVARSQAYQIQSRMSLGYSAGPSMESWKRVASGDC